MKNFKLPQSAAFNPLVIGALSVLRVLIGWHFLYEGLTKLFDPNWTAAGFLMESKGWFAPFFQSLASDPTLLILTDLFNIIGLIAVGLALFLGLSTRLAAGAGAMLLLLYYAATPPMIGLEYSVPGEGSYLIVNKNLIEMAMLVVFAILPGSFTYGLQRIWKLKRASATEKSDQNEAPKSMDYPEEPKPGMVVNRREMLSNLATVPLLGAFAYALVKKRHWDSLEDKYLTDGNTSATVKTFNFAKLEDLKGQVPKGKIGNLEVSRLIAGGNLIGGWAHARDLIYVSKLVKAYHSDDRVISTLQLAERCGINTLVTNPQLTRIIHKYWNKAGGKIQFISDCGVYDDLMKGVQMSIDAGAHACYVQGEIADNLVREGNMEMFGQALEKIRENGLPAGIGAHSIKTIKACVEHGYKPDFWVKTLHHHHYWSAQPNEQHDNMFCYSPEETIEFMESLEEPWIAFKILAAGAISPEEGFNYAFNNGADFVCVGMYDFQVIDDANLTLDVLAKTERRRPWRG